jgi:ParB-like chromosome segregation protein Spo0J
MQVEMFDIATIKPYNHNPRRNDQAVAAVARSIAEFGFRQPIVLDEQDIIVVGDTRYKAALRLGLKQVPVHVARGLTPAQIKAYRLADNKTAELADWDQERLVRELADLQEVQFDVDITGFSAHELQALLGTDISSGRCDPDAVPAPPEAPVTQQGDLWLLGEHRLLCGDLARPDQLARLLDGQVVHLVNTDPPYNLKVEPCSNTAIATDLSSFHVTHPQKLNVVRQPAKPTRRPLRAKDARRGEQPGVGLGFQEPPELCDCHFPIGNREPSRNNGAAGPLVRADPFRVGRRRPHADLDRAIDDGERLPLAVDVPTPLAGIL